MLSDYDLIESLADSYELPDTREFEWPEPDSIDDKVRQVMTKLLTKPTEVPHQEMRRLKQR
jgi:hypothetical protein